LPIVRFDESPTDGGRVNPFFLIGTTWSLNHGTQRNGVRKKSHFLWQKNVVREERFPGGGIRAPGIQ
jgi:hypothetical protein